MDSKAITELLQQAQKGNQRAADQLFPMIYDQLRRLAASFMQRERQGHTMRATDLVHEAYLRLFGTAQIEWQDRGHFFAMAARSMRHILVDYARSHVSQKRGSGGRVDLEYVDGVIAPLDESFVALDDALSRLEKLDKRAAQVVELRYFGGLTEVETAEALKIGLTTMKRDWNTAKTWLRAQLKSKEEEEGKAARAAQAD